MSIGYISGQAKGKRQEAKGGINNQSLITGFSIKTDLVSYQLQCGGAKLAPIMYGREITG
ncbi:MAG: hypothetical protein DWQ53_11055 [Microcystis flos-aquae DF17]|nr:MAG: hypothetical protein DWQ53_11055 [Microcystis flos-aquae DF17]TRT70260.1 MAG: hypothetical protein EWV68_07170 [Microcystis sp. M_QC_C_20170808_M9Col]